MADTGPFSAGDEIGFTVTVTNNGPGKAKNVTVTDDLPNNVTWAIDGPADGFSLDANNDLSYGPTDLANLASHTVHVVATVPAAECGTFTNEATASADNEAATDLTNNTDSDSLTVDCPDVELTKVADTGPFSAGDEIGFTVTVTNNGPGKAKNVTVTDDLPNNVTWAIDGPADGFSLDANNDLSYGPTDLANLASHTVHVVATVPAAECGTFTNEATASADNEAATDLTNNTDSDSLTVDCPDVELTKVADTGPFSAGDEIGFTVTVTNNGPGKAKNVTVTDDLPNNVTWAIDGPADGFSLDANNDLSYGPTDLANLASHTVHVVATVPAAECGTFTNEATASADNEAATDLTNNTDSDSLTVDCPDVELTKVADTGPFSAGDEIGFTVTVTNNGPGKAKTSPSPTTCPTTSPGRSTGRPTASRWMPTTT